MRDRIERYLLALMDGTDDASSPWTNLKGILQHQANLSAEDIENLKKRVFVMKLYGVKADEEITNIIADICMKIEVRP